MTKDRRPAVTILVFLIVFIGSYWTFHPPIAVQLLIAALCAALAWIITPKPRPARPGDRP